MSSLIAISGGSGNMGKEVVKELLASDYDVRIRLFLLDTKKNKMFARKIKNKGKEKVEITFGDINNFTDCMNFVINADYVIHMAAIIPPVADHDFDLTMATNLGGTENLVKSVISCGNMAKFIYISSVAIYGYRNELHPYGRVGDPILPSVFDVYGKSKAMAERFVLESGLSHFAVLRQTGILHKNLLINNSSDGLLFHTPWNVPIEWVTAYDSGVLLRRIIEYDIDEKIPSFFNKIYNIGGGEGCRETGYETFNNGFKIIGGSAKKFFRPSDNVTRNFHCFWFSDSKVLIDMFHLKPMSTKDFWQDFLKEHKIFTLGRLIPAKLLRKLTVERLYTNNNSPIYWIKHNDKARIIANYGSLDAFKKLPKSWNDESILCESSNYSAIKNKTENLLCHGFDENKPLEQIDIEDCRMAARYRGGELIDTTMKTGDLYTKLLWKCAHGHTFYLTPFSVLFGGFWCDKCFGDGFSWNYDEIVKNNPFYESVYYDSHDKKERYVYQIIGNKFTVFEVPK